MAKILAELAPAVTHNPLLGLAGLHGAIVVDLGNQDSADHLSQQCPATPRAVSNSPRMELQGDKASNPLKMTRGELPKATTCLSTRCRRQQVSPEWLTCHGGAHGRRRPVEDI
jgi:hypothetical protein